MALLLSTTGTQSTVVLNDLGQRTFTDPTVNLNLELEYPLWELLASADLFTALSSGWITLTFDGGSVSTSQFTELARGNMQTYTYDTDSNGIVDNAATAGNALNLQGNSGAFYLNRANQTGTQTASTISDFNTAVASAVMLTSGTAGYAVFAGTSGWAANAGYAYSALHAANADTSGDALNLNSQPGSYYLSRANQTGTQTASTISDFYVAMDSGTAGYAFNAGHAINADLLNNQSPSFYLSRANQTGTQTASTISDFYTAMDSGTAGYAFNAASSFVAINANNLNNQNGAYYLSRANHTGTQTASTISDFYTAMDSGTSGYAFNAANAFTLNSQPDTYYLNRANHTGTQPSSTISDFYTAMLAGTSGHANYASTAGYAGTASWAINAGTSGWASNAANAYGLTTSNPASNTNLLNYSTAGNGAWEPIGVKAANVRNSYIISAGVNANSATNRYCNWADGAAMNLNGYVVPTNATIAYITASSNGSYTWTPSVYVNGSSAATLSITSASSGHSSLLNVNVNAGDVLTLYVSGTGVKDPAISAHLFER